MVWCLVNMGNQFSGGATRAVMDFMEKHDRDFTASDIRTNYPTVNFNSIHSALGTLEARGMVIRKGKVSGIILWSRTSLTQCDEALYRFCGINLSRLRACVGLANPASRFDSVGRD